MRHSTVDKLLVLGSVADGQCSADEITDAALLPLDRVLGAAAALRGDGERPELLCCFDGMPWALTEAGARILRALRGRR